MAVDRSRRRPRPVPGVVVTLLLALAVAGPLALPAAAANAQVEVAATPEGSFTPARVEIRVDDLVTWEWTANEPHTVTFGEGGPEGTSCTPAFEPDLDCQGHRYTTRFTTTGEFPYTDEATGSTGVVVVTAPPPSKPTPTSPPSPTASPSPSPTSESPSPEPSPEPPPPSPEPSPTGGDPVPAPTEGTAEPQDVETVSPSPSESPPEPSVAESDTDSPSPVPAPSFEDFPDAEDPTTEDVEGEVAIGGSDDDDGTARLVWSLVGGATVLGTLGAFGRRVLFADPWDG